MPYTIGKDSSCPTSKPFAVKKQGGGVVPGGCHATKDKAQRHLAALQANVEDAQRREVIAGLRRQSLSRSES